MDRFFSFEPILAIKQYRRKDEFYIPTRYLPLHGQGVYTTGEWYDAVQQHPVRINPTTPTTLCGEACMLKYRVAHGFHGWKSEQAEPNAFYSGSPWVHVEFAGLVIEHEKGYRATRQRIVGELTEEERQILYELPHIARWFKERANTKPTEGTVRLLPNFASPSPIKFLDITNS